MGLIRGTQLLSHAVTMAKQSIQEVGKAFLITFFILTACILFQKVDKIHLMSVSSYCKAWFYKYTGDEEKILVVLNRDISGNRLSYKEHLHKAKEVIGRDLTKREIFNLYHIIYRAISISFILTISLIVVGFIIIINKEEKIDKRRFIRGRKIITSKKLNELIKTSYRKERLKVGYSIAGVFFPPYGEMEHLMLVGTTGTGKTVMLKNLIKQIKEQGDKAIIYDYTGAFVKGYFDPEKDVLINPFDKRSRSWCLLKEADNPAEFETIAEALIGNSEAINDPFWPNGARLIFSELCKVQFNKENFKTQDLYNHLLLPISDLNTVLSRTLAQNFTKPSSEKTTLSLLMLMTTYLKGLQYINNDGERDFSIKRWILSEEESNILFLSTKSVLHSSVQPLISAMMDIAINNISELPVGSRKRVWIIFDEIASLNYLPSLEKGLTVSRNFGGCFVIALQSISQLIRRYGVQDAETISSNCSSKIILKAGNNQTTRWASQLLGTQEVEECNESLSYGAHSVRDGVNFTKNRFERSIALASEIASLPKFQGYALMTGGFPIAAINFEHLKGEKSVFNNPSYLAYTKIP